MTSESVLASQIDRDSGDSWTCPENPTNGEGVGGKIIILSIAMNRSHKSFEYSSNGIAFQWNSHYPGSIANINIIMWTLFVVVLLLQFIKRMWFPSSTSEQSIIQVG